MAFVGGPRLGKTTTRRRLTGEIIDIASAGEAEQPSTGAVESGRVIIRNLSSTTAMVTKTEWLAAKNLTDEAHMFLQYFYQQIFQQKASFNEESVSDRSSIHDETPSTHMTELSNTNLTSPEAPSSERKLSDPPPLMERGRSPLPSDVEEMANLFRDAMNAKNWSHMKQLFKDAALLNMEDAGGQPELMDMLPAFTISPGLYLLFCKLINDLQKSYTISYLSPSGESTLPVESTYTVEEVLLSALSSIACFKSYSSQESNEGASDSKLDEFLASSSKSVAYIIGTHKDKVSEEEIDKFDEKLQRTIRSTDFFRDDLVQFSSEGRMVLPVDNMTGGADEIREVRTFLEKGLQKHFKKLRIPAAWLMLSLCLRKRDKRIASLQSCLQLAERLGIQRQLCGSSTTMPES